jgi:ABC-type transport system substrate-binding protein
MFRRTLAALLAVVPAFALADAPKVFRYAFEVAETSFDPHFVSDAYSNIVNQAMFEAPLTYDYLARPLKLQPLTATALPEISADGRTYTIRIKPGIFFMDDAAFGGKKRELVAADYVYSLKRLLDPRVRASQISEVEPYIVGAEEAAIRARKEGKLDYDAPLEGIRAVDKYTYQVRIKEALGTFIYKFADCRISCAVAREVVERYGDDFGSHPVGTGPWKLGFWKRSSKMVFERNPAFRDEVFEAEPAADDPKSQEIYAKLKGRKMPMVDRVEVSIIEETQPRWLSFMNGEMDLVFLVPEEYAYQAFPGKKVAPNLARRGIEMHQIPALDLTYNFFNMKDPVVGGYTPEKVALRRAISLSYKTSDEINIIRKGQAIPAQTPYSPGVAGYDPAFRTTANEYDVSKARALLDMFGYVDRDGDGFREMPDGSPLVINFYSTPNARDQQFDQLWKRSLDDIGLRLNVVKRKWPDILKAARSPQGVQFWQLGGSASEPDADTWLQSLYGPNIEGNLAKFDLDAFNKAYVKARHLQDTPERTRLYQEMAKLMVAYVPWRVNTHRIRTDMWYPQVVGYRKSPLFTYNFWKYIDIEQAAQ